jgi:hypothetical protein
VNVTAGTLSGLGCARKLACCCLICWIFCGSGFFAPAAGLTALVELVCATDGAALADAAVAGVVVAPAAGVVLALAAAGVVAVGATGVVAAAGVVAVVGAGLAFVFGEAGVALGDVLALAAGVFEFLLFRRD